MLTTFSVGAEIDIATADELNGMGKSLLRKMDAGGPKPNIQRRSHALVGTGTVATLSMGGPTTGYVWQLDHIVLFGADAFTVVGGGLVGSVFMGGYKDNVSLSGLLLANLAFPSSQDFLDGSWIQHHESVFVQTSIALPLGQQIGCNMSLREWRIKDILNTQGDPNA